MARVKVEVVAYAPSEFFHCMHCELVWQQAGMGSKIHAEQRSASLPDDLAAQYERIGEWVAGLVERHRTEVEIHVVDAASPEGLLKAIHYRLWRFPAFVVDGRAFPGRTEDFSVVDAAIEESLAASPTTTVPRSR